MPRSIQNQNKITLRYLITNTYVNMPSRIKNMERDVLRSVTVQNVSVYDGKNPGEARTKYVIRSYSYPQYKPYYDGGKTKWGHPRSKQRTYKHQYDVTIQMEELSLDCDAIKLRTGADARWDFTKNGKGYWVGKGRQKHYIEGSNVKRGLYAQAGILFGRNFANGMPRKTNPNNVLFLDKHMLNVVKLLVDKGIIQ